MAIKKEALKTIETALGLPEGEIIKLWADAAEHDLPQLATVEIIPKTDLATRMDNLGKERYDAGKIAGVETTVKTIKTTFGLDVAKTIPIDELASTIKVKVIADAKIPEADKVRELNGDITTLQKQNKELTDKVTGLETTYQEEKNTIKIRSAIITALPKPGDKPGELLIASEDVAELALKKAEANGIKPAFSDTGEVIWKKGNDILKDANLVAQKAEVVLKDYYQPFVRPAGGGGGGGDGTGTGKAGGLEAFTEEMKKAGVSQSSEAFNREMAKRMKAGTLKL